MQMTLPGRLRWVTTWSTFYTDSTLGWMAINSVMCAVHAYLLFITYMGYAYLFYSTPTVTGLEYRTE